MRVCMECGLQKPLEQFYFLKCRRYYIHSCIPCHRRKCRDRNYRERKRPYSYAWYRYKFGNHKRSAEARDVSFELTFADFKSILVPLVKCHYCKQRDGTGIDRRDNNVGYVKNNCVAACKVCNNRKSHRYTEAEMMILAAAYSRIEQMRSLR
jgi:hypothetical protein